MNIEILVIGNEILIGKTQDTNSNWMAKRIARYGHRLKRITTIGDELDLISSTLHRRSCRLSISTTAVFPSLRNCPTPRQPTLNWDCARRFWSVRITPNMAKSSRDLLCFVVNHRWIECYYPFSWRQFYCFLKDGLSKAIQEIRTLNKTLLFLFSRNGFGVINRRRFVPEQCL